VIFKICLSFFGAVLFSLASLASLVSLLSFVASFSALTGLAVLGVLGLVYYDYAVGGLTTTFSSLLFLIILVTGVLGV